MNGYNDGIDCWKITEQKDRVSLGAEAEHCIEETKFQLVLQLRWNVKRIDNRSKTSLVEIDLQVEK